MEFIEFFVIFIDFSDLLLDEEDVLVENLLVEDIFFVIKSRGIRFKE